MSKELKRQKGLRCAQKTVHDSGDSRFLMIIQVGKIWMQTISKALWLLSWRIDFLNILSARTSLIQSKRQVCQHLLRLTNGLQDAPIIQLYYSLISGLVVAVICGRYFRNRSYDLNPILRFLGVKPHSSTRKTQKKTVKPVKTQTTIC